MQAHALGHTVEHTVEAEYWSMKSATQAMSALEWAGIEAANVDMAGPAVEHAFYKRDTQQRDTRMARDLVKRAGTGILLGVIVAGLAGGIAGLIAGRVYGLDAYDAWLTCGLGALLGGIIGAATGGVVGGEMALNINEASDFKYDDSVPGEPAIVRVHVRDEQMAERATAILQAKRPRSIHHLADGEPEAYAG